MELLGRRLALALDQVEAEEEEEKAGVGGRVAGTLAAEIDERRLPVEAVQCLVHDPVTAVHDDRQAVVEALAGVSARQREALVLRFWMDLPLAAIADAMGVRIGTVKSQISRGLDVVGAALREEAER